MLIDSGSTKSFIDPSIAQCAGTQHQNVKFDRPVQKGSSELSTPTFNFSTPKQPDTESMFVNVDNDEDSLFIQPLDEIVDIIEHEQVNLEYQNNRPENPDETVHSNADQHPIQTIPIVDYAVNQGNNQIIISTVPRNHRNPWYDNVEEFRK
ncbi:unnamed protein product [Acanthoscelides obtectus]|uniref:Uncharacterized protein n=1 Tax=Acanthoscelides obtectus TaxID=200917 RepID=A0A9P0Q272_ACAOB|nr:unnamed protein product [Acanthoscelides obtectus]CAK1671161.1 hypothetical protein AOBTE_LOCUS28100 [Acanthoscelides obtectus]